MDPQLGSFNLTGADNKGILSLLTAIQQTGEKYTAGTVSAQSPHTTLDKSGLPPNPPVLDEQHSPPLVAAEKEEEEERLARSYSTHHNTPLHHARSYSTHHNTPLHHLTLEGVGEVPAREDVEDAEVALQTEFISLADIPSCLVCSKPPVVEPDSDSLNMVDVYSQISSSSYSPQMEDMEAPTVLALLQEIVHEVGTVDAKTSNLICTECFEIVQFIQKLTTQLFDYKGIIKRRFTEFGGKRRDNGAGLPDQLVGGSGMNLGGEGGSNAGIQDHQDTLSYADAVLDIKMPLQFLDSQIKDEDMSSLAAGKKSKLQILAETLEGAEMDFDIPGEEDEDEEDDDDGLVSQPGVPQLSMPPSVLSPQQQQLEEENTNSLSSTASTFSLAAAGSDAPKTEGSSKRRRQAAAAASLTPSGGSDPYPCPLLCGKLFRQPAALRSHLRAKNGGGHCLPESAVRELVAGTGGGGGAVRRNAGTDVLLHAAQQELLHHHHPQVPPTITTPAGGPVGGGEVVGVAEDIGQSAVVSRCPVCRVEMPSGVCLSEHVLANHRGAGPEKMLACRLCPERFSSKHQKTVHERQHKGEKSSLVCDECGEGFQSSQALTHHKSKHTGKFMYECKDCRKGFNNYKLLEEHSHIHTGDKPYACQHCDKTFANRGSLWVHNKRHEVAGGKPYTCPYCTKAFNHSSHLVVHKRIHTGERPYTCRLCTADSSGKTVGFIAGNYLKRHVAQVHKNQLAFGCELCSRAFAKRTELVKHAHSEHGGRGLVTVNNSSSRGGGNMGGNSSAGAVGGEQGLAPPATIFCNRGDGITTAGETTAEVVDRDMSRFVVAASAPTNNGQVVVDGMAGDVKLGGLVSSVGDGGGGGVMVVGGNSTHCKGMMGINSDSPSGDNAGTESSTTTTTTYFLETNDSGKLVFSSQVAAESGGGGGGEVEGGQNHGDDDYMLSPLSLLEGGGGGSGVVVGGVGGGGGVVGVGVQGGLEGVDVLEQASRLSGQLGETIVLIQVPNSRSLQQ